MAAAPEATLAYRDNIKNDSPMGQKLGHPQAGSDSNCNSSNSLSTPSYCNPQTLPRVSCTLEDTQKDPSSKEKCTMVHVRFRTHTSEKGAQQTEHQGQSGQEALGHASIHRCTSVFEGVEEPTQAGLATEHQGLRTHQHSGSRPASHRDTGWQS